MNQPGTAAKGTTIIQGTAVRSCELRLERRAVDGNEQERVEYICGASGGPEHGYVLVRRFPVGKRGLPVVQSQMLYAQPTQSGEQADVFFPCRWFYSLDGQNQPRHTLLCRACPYWFPRPPLELLTDYWPMTQKMLRVVNGEEKIARPRTGFTPSARQSSRKTWWQRILQKILF